MDLSARSERRRLVRRRRAGLPRARRGARAARPSRGVARETGLRVTLVARDGRVLADSHVEDGRAGEPRPAAPRSCRRGRRRSGTRGGSPDAGYDALRRRVHTVLHARHAGSSGSRRAVGSCAAGLAVPRRSARRRRRVHARSRSARAVGPSSRCPSGCWLARRTRPRSRRWSAWPRTCARAATTAASRPRAARRDRRPGRRRSTASAPRSRERIAEPFPRGRPAARDVRRHGRGRRRRRRGGPRRFCNEPRARMLAIRSERRRATRLGAGARRRARGRCCELAPPSTQASTRIELVPRQNARARAAAPTPAPTRAAVGRGLVMVLHDITRAAPARERPPRLRGQRLARAQDAADGDPGLRRDAARAARCTTRRTTRALPAAHQRQRRAPAPPRHRPAEPRAHRVAGPPGRARGPVDWLRPVRRGACAASPRRDRAEGRDARRRRPRAARVRGDPRGHDAGARQPVDNAIQYTPGAGSHPVRAHDARRQRRPRGRGHRLGIPRRTASASSSASTAWTRRARASWAAPVSACRSSSTWSPRSTATVSLESELGRGSRFTVELPLAAG